MLRRSARSASIAPQGNEDADHGIDPKTGVEALGQPEARGRRRSDDVAGVWEATVVLAKRYQDRIADALSGEALPLFKYYRTRTNTNPNDTEANAAGRSVRACVARKSKS